MQLGKEKFIAAVRRFMQIDRLSAPLLQELIDRIDVYEVTGTGKNRKQMIKIHYKFVGYMELTSLARRHNYREKPEKALPLNMSQMLYRHNKKSRIIPAHTHKKMQNVGKKKSSVHIQRSGWL